MALAADEYRSGGQVFDGEGRRSVTLAGGAGLEEGQYRSGGRVLDADGREVVAAAGSVGSVAVVDAGTNLSTARPSAPVVYWQFDAGVDVGVEGANVTNAQPGDLIFVAT